MDLLHARVQHYAWGSPTAIPDLLGCEGDGRPWAELWMGAHPAAPSTIDRGSGPLTLDALIDADPDSTLGPAASAFDRLPFLVKVLAAAAPLSLQAHPTAAQAEAGFRREEQAGIDRSAPERRYRDASHKPELICALTPFTALCGLRDPADSARLLDSFEVAALSPVISLLLEATDGDVRPALEWILGLPNERAHDIATSVALAASDDSGGAFAREHHWARRIAEHHPGDIGVVTAMLLHLIELAPGQALFLAGATMHAYLEGTGVEVMASSDNVIRAGLTVKHVDVQELLSVVRTTAERVSILTPTQDADEAVYNTPAREFRLSVIQVSKRPIALTAVGPEILLCTAGEVTIQDDSEHLDLRAGHACFIPGSTGRYRLDGSGTVYRTTVG